jgi:uncharacterized protein YbcC (UPF0753/DUF2309 family)
MKTITLSESGAIHSTASAEKRSADMLDDIIHDLKHYLPAQASLKDFIHHNTLHAFQSMKFGTALQQANAIFGYKTSLSLGEYRALYKAGRISETMLKKAIHERKGADQEAQWHINAISRAFQDNGEKRIGKVRGAWKNALKVDIDSEVHPQLFRILCSYLDQGISIWNFPVWQRGFLPSLKELERNSFTSFFRTRKAKDLLIHSSCELDTLLKMVVGDPSLYKEYLFDQQFAHQGWAGLVSAIEDQPQTLLDHKKISLHDLIVFELLLEIDTMIYHFGERWKPLSEYCTVTEKLFDPIPTSELHETLMIWQDAFEWTYYDSVLGGIQQQRFANKVSSPSFQAMFCIDDRECSFRRYIEKLDPAAETFGTPGFFGVEFFFKPEHGKFYTKLCPAPVTPAFLIKEEGTKGKRKKDVHFTKQSHTLFRGWVISQTVGFWSALKLFFSIFRPSAGPASARSFEHMDKYSRLTIENHNDQKENDLRVGFTVEEMANRMEGLLKSIGLVKDFAPLVYLFGHGASSTNNPHYAAYDCGACCGRPGSVNARVAAHMANHPKVRAILAERGISIPDHTQFVGGLHDTTRDEIMYYDVFALTPANVALHEKNVATLTQALDLNSKERSRRFESINTKASPEKIHKKIRQRAVSLFEPRPELNHATNALCIVGRRELTKQVFLDRRSFMNSFDYRVDPEGKYLFNILKAAAPVCGGINLEYYFSRVDNEKLGAGTKLPHNVMGLFGVANGTDGDLRPGLPNQMIEVHDPVRLLIIVEHFPDVILNTIKRSPETYEWFINEWVNLIAINPETRELSRFVAGRFVPYTVLTRVEQVDDLTPLFSQHQDNMPVYTFS